MNSLFLPYIIIWIGVVLAVAEHVHIVFNEWILAERHKRMPFAEVIGHLMVGIVLGVAGAILAKRALSSSTLFLAMVLWFASFKIHDKHRSIVMALLRVAVAYSLRQGRINRAKTLGSRLFDLMIVERLVSKSRSVKWRFAKSSMVLAQMREILGDYPLAQPGCRISRPS